VGRGEALKAGTGIDLHGEVFTGLLGSAGENTPGLRGADAHLGVRHKVELAVDGVVSLTFKRFLRH